MRRIYFYSGKGIAQTHWDHPAVELETKPELGFAFEELDYEPALQVYEVRIAGEKRREMTKQERDGCFQYLESLAKPKWEE
jgi:hypothetical protein